EVEHILYRTWDTVGTGLARPPRGGGLDPPVRARGGGATAGGRVAVDRSRRGAYGGLARPRRATVDLERTSKRAASVECDPARGLTAIGGADGRIERVRGDRPHLTAQVRGPNNASWNRGALTP